MASSIGKSSVTSFWSAMSTFMSHSSFACLFSGAGDRVAVELDAEPGRVEQAELARARGVRSGAADQVLDEQLVHDLVAVGEVGGAAGRGGAGRRR